jgi:hypothetical protein
MEIFAKTLDAWGAILSLAQDREGKFQWTIWVEDRRSKPTLTSRIQSPDTFASAEEAIVDGHSALEGLTPARKTA